MNTKTIIDNIGIKLFVQLLLLENNILKKIKIQFKENIINFLLIHYKHLFYSFSKNNYFVFIYLNNNSSNFNINICNKNLNPCTSNSNIKNKYEIIIFFHFNKKKLFVPLSLFQFNCSNNNYKSLNQFTNNISKILYKNNFLKNEISSIIINKI